MGEIRALAFYRVFVAAALLMIGSPRRCSWCCFTTSATAIVAERYYRHLNANPDCRCLGVSSYNKFYMAMVCNGFTPSTITARACTGQISPVHEQIRAEQKARVFTPSALATRWVFSRKRIREWPPHEDYSFYWEGIHGKGVLLVHGAYGRPTEMKFIGNGSTSVALPSMRRHFPDIVRMKGHCSGQS